jgi:membrane protein involved in colicin uptake
VFGSVVGCVVVPIVSQIIKTQSMECVILSAIVISLTAAHLKTSKKSDVPNTKIVFKEAEKRKVVHTNSKKKNNVKEQLHRQAQEELEYIQQFEHLKIQELEKRQEDKKLKKMKKREEKLRLRKEN